MDGYNADLVLQVIQYLNVIDSGRLAVCAKRYYYLVHQYRILSGPELVTYSSYNPSTKLQLGSKDVIQEAISQMQKAPNLALAFNSPRSALSDELPRRLTKSDSIILGATAGNIQVNRQGTLEHKSNGAVMLANFPNAVVQPFTLEYGPQIEEDIETFKVKLERKADIRWKAMIVYACGHGSAFVDSFVSSMQRTLPDVAIVGGICSSGYVSTPAPTEKAELSRLTTRQLKNLLRTLGGEEKVYLEKLELVDDVFQLSKNRHTLIHCDDTVFGIVLGGDAPVRSVVSRGVESVLPSLSSLVVESTILSRPGDDTFMFTGSDLKPIHMIQQLRNTGEEGKVFSARELMNQVSNAADYIGIKRPSQDGYELHMMFPGFTEAFLVMTRSEEEEASLQGAEIDFFALDGMACRDDMDTTMQKLKEQTKGEEILGGIMFSCSGRGPGGGLMREVMGDAQRFANVFPEVPCLGFYAGGEIGPLALARNEKVFQTGRVAVQGFTAVFALFIVPVVERMPSYQLDDCQENVMNFIRSRLS